MDQKSSVSSMRQHNSLLNHREFVDRAVALHSRPRMLFLELTRACNLSCPMCRPSRLSGKSLTMRQEVLDRVVDELFPYVECVDLRGWGESTLDLRLEHLIDQLNGAGTQTKLYTNLSARTPIYWRGIGRRQTMIAVSIDAATPTLYEKLRRGARFPRLLRNLHALRDEQLKRAGRQDILFSCIISDENIQEIPLLVELAKEYHIPTVRFDPITSPDEGRTYPRIGINQESSSALRSALSEAIGLAKQHDIELQLGANLSCRASIGGYDLCVHPWSYVYVRYDGGIGFCDHVMTHTDSIFGNIMKNTFMDIWNNTDYQRLRREHLDKRFTRLHHIGIECDWCYQHRYADYEHLFEKQYMPLQLSDSTNLDVLM